MPPPLQQQTCIYYVRRGIRVGVDERLEDRVVLEKLCIWGVPFARAVYGRAVALELYYGSYRVIPYLPECNIEMTCSIQCHIYIYPTTGWPILER